MTYCVETPMKLASAIFPVMRLRPSVIVPASSAWVMEIFSGRTPISTRPPAVAGGGAALGGQQQLAAAGLQDDVVAALGVDLGLDQVGRAEEVRDERGLRVLVQVGGRAELLDAARVHHGDRVGHGHGLLLVVRDMHEGDADLGLDALELQLHLAAQLQVEGAERLVEQQHLRVVDQRAGHSDALLLAAGELVGFLPGLLAQLDQLQHLLDLLLHALDAASAQTEGDVLEDVEVREEGVGLEHRVHGPLVRRQRGDVLVAEVDGAAAGFLQAGDHAQGGGLAAAGRAEQGEEGALRDGQVERVHGGEGAVRLADSGEADVAAVVCGLHRRHAPVSFANFVS
ncbi:hypothetical protein GCM10020256_19520 [Streptomyces thermocoprophilus]